MKIDRFFTKVKKMEKNKKDELYFYVSSFWCIPACITFTSFNDIGSEIDRKRMNIPQIAIKYYTIMSLIQKNCMPRANRYFYAQINKEYDVATNCGFSENEY